MKPSEYKKRILLCVTGRSPAIVTEVLYALATEEGFVPNEIQIITTKQGKKDISVLFEKKSAFHELCSKLRITEPIHFDESCINVISKGEIQLDDIRTAADNDAAANSIVDTVRTLCQDKDSAIHISMAGGRKTMGFYMAYALSLFGRPQDQLSHVLVSNEFEGCPDFYFPTQSQQEIQDRNKKHTYIAKDAKIELAKIPLVLLRDTLPANFLKDQDYTKIVSAAQSNLPGPLSLEFDIKNLAVIFKNEKMVIREPLQFAILLWLAFRKVYNEPGVCIYTDKNGDYYPELLYYYEAVIGDEANVALEEYLLKKIRAINSGENEKEGFDNPNVKHLKDRYWSHRANIHTLIKKTYGMRGFAEFQIASTRNSANRAVHELSIPAENITLPKGIKPYPGFDKAFKERIMKRLKLNKTISNFYNAL